MPGFEEVFREGILGVYRMRVFSGWLIRVVERETSCTFVPDPLHEWTLPAPEVK